MDRILTQRELTIDLSLPAMTAIAGALDDSFIVDASVLCEIENFRNTLLNLIERGVDCANRRHLTDEELCS
jgi:hypothetical protein